MTVAMRQALRVRRAARAGAVAGLLVAALAGACAPLSPTPPFHFGETPDTLARGRTALSGAIGGGSFEDIGGGVGAAVRVRHGLGGRNELRAEAAAIVRINDDDPTPAQPWLGKSAALLYKLSWKRGLTDWLAVDLGAGGSHSETGNALGGDLAVSIATPRAYFGGRVRPYLGVRGQLAVPVGRDTDEAGGITETAVVAVGGAYDASGTTQLFLELGGTHEWNRGYFATSADPAREIQSQDHPGAYLAAGVTWFFGGRSRRVTGPTAGP